MSKFLLFTTEVLRDMCSVKNERVHNEDLSEDLMFPPQYHSATIIKESDNEVRIVAFGGQYPESQNITKTVNELVIFTFKWDSQCCWQEKTDRVKPIRHWVKVQSDHIYRGSWMPRLSNSDCVYNNNILTIWGGFLIDENSPSSDLYLFSGLDSDVIDSTLYPGPETAKRGGINLSGTSSHQSTVQTGAVPTRRSGHTLSLVDEQFAVVLGGLTSTSNGPRIFKSHPSDTIALLDLYRQNWFPLKVDGNKSILNRAYRATVSKDGSLFISGGCFFKDGKLSSRLNALCIIKCLVNTGAKEVVVLSSINCTVDGLQIEQFLAQHSVSYKDNTLFMFGGLAGETGKGDKVSQLLEVCLSSKTTIAVAIPQHLKRISSVCGASSHWLGSSTLLILGGSKPELGGRSNFMYTTLEMAPKVCDFQKKCIVDLNFAGDLKLVGCDLCLGWFHICCDKKLDPLKLPPIYICPDCKLKQKTRNDPARLQAETIKNKRVAKKTVEKPQNREDIPVNSETYSDEQTFCQCHQVAYGDMVGCDNDLCPFQWFHFDCVQLEGAPKGKWFCLMCRGDKSSAMKPKAQFLKELEKYNKERENKVK